MSLRRRLFGLLPHRLRREVEEQIRKEEAWPTIQRATELISHGEEDEAYEFLEQAVKRFPDRAEVHLLYATVLMSVHPEDAVAEAIRAIELAPYEPWYLIRAAWLMFWMAHPELARDYAARAREMGGEDSIFGPELIQLEAHFALEDGDEEAAEAGFRLALEREPENGDIAVDLAAFLSDRERRVEALEVVDRSLPIVKRKDGLKRLQAELRGDA